MSTFLPPIERPRRWSIKLLYYISKRKYGKVMTGLKVNSARMPFSFTMFYGRVSQLDKKLVLPAELVLLIRQHVAQLNICTFCMDISRYKAIKASFSIDKFDELHKYSFSSLFDEREVTALDYATELTTKRQPSPDTFARLARHFSEREIVEIVHVVATEHLYNLSNLGLNIHSDMLCDISKLQKTS